MNEEHKELRIVFMGTPGFAVASLEALFKSGFNIVGVITAPDKPAGRGMKLNESAVKKFALENNLRILQPQRLKNPSFLEELKMLNADLQVVVAFRMLPEIIWKMPPLGTINLHASLLPQYRGAAPINWAIINGEKETGVTTFKLKHEIDTGDILMQEKIQIGPNETAGELHDRMKAIGAKLLVETVKGLVTDRIKEIPQSAIGNISLAIHYAPKITNETCRINWNEKAEQINNLVRGLSPIPGAFTQFNGKMMKIFKSRFDLVQAPAAPGKWESDQRSFLRCSCADGYLYVLDLQLEGKKRMPVEDFLRGYKFKL